jgi:hypothetical protein
MENNTVKYIAIGAAAVAVIGGIYYFMKSENDTEAVEAAVEQALTYDALITEMKQDISKMNTVPKYDGGRLSENYLLNVFYVLSKYTALAKLCESEASFNARIEALKEGKDAEYATLRRQTDQEEAKRMEEMQAIVFKEFDCTETEYMSGYQANFYKPQFVQRMQELQQKVVEDVQTRSPEAELPAGLTKEKAEEIRDFAKAQTQNVILQLQSTMTNQNDFNEKFMFEVSKLDDVIFLKYGFKNTDVLKAFQKYNLIPNQGPAMVY